MCSLSQGDDHTLDRLLELDGEIMLVSSDGAYWVKFQVRRVTATPARPHGLSYALTLHGPRNERLVAFDTRTQLGRRRGADLKTIATSATGRSRTPIPTRSNSRAHSGLKSIGFSKSEQYSD